MATNLTVEGNTGTCGFLAFGSSSSLTLSVGGSNDTMESIAEIWDNGADLTTGSSTAFTAPVTGKYMLIFSGRLAALDIDSDYYYSYIVTSNRIYSRVLDANDLGWGSDVGYMAMPAVSCVADMDAGDTAVPQWYQSVGGSVQTQQHGDTYFCGFLCA